MENATAFMKFLAASSGILPQTFHFLFAVRPVAPTKLAARCDVVEDFTVTVSALSHENAEDVKILGLEDAFRWENRLGHSKVALFKLSGS